MAVTNFQSVISTQSVGTADVDKLAQAFDKLSGAIDGAGKKSKNLNESADFNAFAAKVKQGIQDPLGALGGAVESALLKLGPFGLGITAAVGVLAKVGLDAQRGLAAFGDRIGDISVRTGLTVKEVQEFGLGMKMAGGDIASLEGLMRKLSQGLADGGDEGRTSAEALKELGVKTRDLQGNSGTWIVSGSSPNRRMVIFLASFGHHSR